MRVSQQIGWSQESKLIYQIVKQTERVNQLLPGNQASYNNTPVSKMIGWSNEASLYYEWLRSLDKLTQHYSNCCTTTTTTTINPGLTMAVAPSINFDIPAQTGSGDSDFTIEWWAKIVEDSGHPRVWSVGSWPAAAHAVSIESNGTVYYWINGSIILTADISVKIEDWLGVWATFAIARNGNNVSFYLNGDLVAMGTYTGAIPSNGLPLYIGSEGNDSVVNGYMSNFRWTNIDLCGPGYSPSPVPLSPLPQTKLLILQGNSLPLELTDNSGVTPPNSIANSTGIYSADNPFVGYEGSVQFGIV